MGFLRALRFPPTGKLTGWVRINTAKEVNLNCCENSYFQNTNSSFQNTNSSFQNTNSSFQNTNSSFQNTNSSIQKPIYVLGVVDDRGKFIYISQEELEAVAKFIKQRGRVSISDISDSSNSLINLEAALQRREVQPIESPA